MSGTSTIRAFDRSEEFKTNFLRLLNNNILATQMQGATTGWFGIRVDLLAFTIMLTLTLLCVIARDFKDINLIILSILLPSVLNIQDSLIWCLKTFMQLQGNMVAAERCMNLAKVPKERFAQGERPPLNVLPES